LDVPAPQLRSALWGAGLAGILSIALVLRLHGIHDPILDHPGWRQGDTAAIARNFARLRFDIMYPQTLYNGPPPNYVELELQIVPFLAASLYKIFGIHEIFGRIVSLAFGLGTVALVAYFGRWLFAAELAGLAAGFLYGVFPGSVYYGRTFMPDTAMVFFLTAALYAAARTLCARDAPTWRGVGGTTALLTLAYLAKPVAAVAVVPIAGLIAERLRLRRPVPFVPIAILIAVPFLTLFLYDRRVDSYAEWHWASGITRLHVLPALRGAFASGAGFYLKLVAFKNAIGMLRQTMLGTIGFALALAGFVALPWTRARSTWLVWGWLAGGLLYMFVVVTVERVDYYTYPLLPLCALAGGGATGAFLAAVAAAGISRAARVALFALVPIVGLTALAGARAPVAGYYRYSKATYRNAVALDRRLPKDALVVIGHYGPDLQYYLDRFGWEEDPLLWTPFDEESAIRKGARYFISVEDGRLRHNVELCAWLQRFPVLDPHAQWPVYQTDPAKVSPAADRFWQAFRRAERAHAARPFLDAHGLCLTARSR